MAKNRSDNPKVPGDDRDKEAADAFDPADPNRTPPLGNRANESSPSHPRPGTVADQVPTGDVVPGVSAPSGAPTGPGGQGPDNAGPVPSPEKADPGRNVQGTTGAPPSLATGKPQNALGDIQPSTGRVGGTAGSPGIAGGPADDTSVRQFVDAARNTLQSAIAGRWGETVTGAGNLLTVFADMFGGNIFTSSGTLHPTEENRAMGPEFDALADECRRARERVMEVQSRTRKVRWAGEHDHTTGSPPGLAADPKTMDPASIMLIIELVAKLIEEIRKRRHPNG
jgi:hypothetical protein